MQLKDQVTSLELSKRMKELGFEQKSLFSWFECKHHNSEKSQWYIEQTEEIPYSLCDDPQNITSAYTVGELGEMLPMYRNWDEGFGQWEEEYFPVETTKYNYEWICRVPREYGEIGLDFDTDNDDKDINEILIKGFCDKTEANARAKMLIYLKENNLI